MMKLMLSVAALALATIAAPAGAATLFDNGPVVNSSGLSLLTSPATTYGATANTVSGFSLADNFTVGGAGWNVQSIDFYGYQTQTGTGVFTFTGATWSVIRGTDVNTGVVVASGTTLVTNGGLVGYRTLDTAPTNQNRAIFRVSADVTDFNLTAGSYFLTWSLAGTGASGPFVPPVVGSLGTGNGMQASAGGSFALLTDSGSLQGYDLPFTINGAALGGAVPEPASWALMIAGVGLVGGTLRRRRTSTTLRFA